VKVKVNCKELFLRLLIILLAFNVSSSFAESPCWFWNPVIEKHMGFIGSASRFSIQPRGSVLASRKKALHRFSDFNRIDVSSVNDSDILKNELNIEGWSIRFSEPYVTDDALYSYALASDPKQNSNDKAIDFWLTKKCPPQDCAFQRCSPDWLCNSASNHIFGVSQIASTASKQLSLMHKNAAIFDSYLRKSNVESISKTVASTGENQDWQFTSQQSSVEASIDEQSYSLLNTQICKSESYIVGLFQQPEAKLIASKTFSEWRVNSNLNESVGVTGTFDGLTADGLLSTAVKLAIKNGLIELAKIKNVSIDHEYQLTFLNGWYSLTKSTESTSATVSAVLMDLKVVEEDKKLVMFVWLLDI
jgi:hypothetical protein